MTNIIQMGQYQSPIVLPPELKAINNWLVWRLVYKVAEPKPRKLPFYISGVPREEHGTTKDREQLTTFARAVKTSESGGYSGIGFAPLPGSGIVALDFDNCVKDGVIAPHVLELIGDTYSEFSPSGNGIRAFFSGNASSNSDSKGLKGPFPIEVFGDSGYVTVTGNATPLCKAFELMTTLAPLSKPVRKMIASRGWGARDLSDVIVPEDLFPGSVAIERTAVQGDPLVGDLARLNVAERVGLSIAEIRSVLSRVPSNRGRDEWVKVLAAIHHETNGQGYELALEWSRSTDSFASDDDVLGRWRSFGKNDSKKPITFRFVQALAAELVKTEKYDLVDAYRQEIKDVETEFKLREVLCKKISLDASLDIDGREHVAKAVSAKLKSLGAELPLSRCRQLVTQPAGKAEDLPPWAMGWCYVTDEDKFFRYDSTEWLTKQGFSAKFSRYCDGQDACHHVLVNLKLKTFQSSVYMPTAGVEFEFNRAKCVNTYMPSSVPMPAKEWTPEGLEAVHLLTTHIKTICSGREREAGLLLSWIAHNVQKPGVKIRWAPLIKGVQGDGKTLIQKAISLVMGGVNVNQVSPTVLADSNFTPWGEGACIVVFQEVKVTGPNKHDVLNKVKPFITDDDVSIHPKGGHERKIQNFTNYMGMTNEEDGLPLDDDDRRWFVLFTPWRNAHDLCKVCDPAYFDRLNDAIKAHPSTLRKFFLEYPLAGEFKPNSRAPHTIEHDRMVAMARSEEEDVVRDVLEAGAMGVGKNVLITSYLRSAIQLGVRNFEFRTRAVSRILTKMGWTKYPQRIRFNGLPEHVWTYGTDHSHWSIVKALAVTMDIATKGLSDGHSDDPFAV